MEQQDIIVGQSFIFITRVVLREIRVAATLTMVFFTIIFFIVCTKFIFVFVLYDALKMFFGMVIDFYAMFGQIFSAQHNAGGVV